MAGEQIAGLEDVDARNVVLRADEVILGVDHALTLGVLDHEFGVERNQRGHRIRRMDGHAAIGAEDGVLAVAAYRCVGIANVATGAVAWPGAAIVPAARVLRNVAAERALVANLCGEATTETASARMP